MSGYARVIVALAALWGVSAHAQTAPDGWRVETSFGAWMATSPDHVRLVFYPAVKSKGTFVYWFEDQGLRQTYRFGLNVRSQADSQRTLQPPAPPLLAQARVLADDTGGLTAVYSYAWETPKGRELAQIVLPGGVGKDAASYKAAFERLTSAWRDSFAYIPPEDASD